MTREPAKRTDRTDAQMTVAKKKLLIQAAEEARDEAELTYSHLRAVLAQIENGSMTVEGAGAAIKGLLPENWDTTALKKQLRAAGLDHLADRLGALEEDQ